MSHPHSRSAHTHTSGSPPIPIPPGRQRQRFLVLTLTNRLGWWQQHIGGGSGLGLGPTERNWAETPFIAGTDLAAYSGIEMLRLKSLCPTGRTGPSSLDWPIMI